MKIGIMSDTHDHLPNIRKAIAVFNDEKVDMVIHCGDFVSLFVIKEFENLNSKIVGVLGNNDGEKTLLKEWLKELDSDRITSYNVCYTKLLRFLFLFCFDKY